MFSSLRRDMPGGGLNLSRWHLCVAVCLLGLFGNSASLCEESGVPAEFSGDRAMELLIAQCDLGPRTPGSVGNRQLREMIVETARSGGLEVNTLCFDAVDPLSGEAVRLCNVVVSAGPTGGQRLWLGAHYDTRPISDHDDDPELRSTPLAGANDGASGVAVLLHLMEILADNPPPQGVDLMFLDGEDSGLAGSSDGFCLGSRRLAETCRDFGNPLARGTPRGVVILDMVGEKNLQIPMEGFSMVNAPAWTAAIFERAEKLGLAAFVPERGPGVFDDHVPFLQQGIPAVDLIDFDFPQWHTTADTPAICSGASLAQVGRLVMDLIYNP
ncbi:MAG: M28 family peptidase [Candidatus Krumholzibacteriota bacterium]